MEAVSGPFKRDYKMPISVVWFVCSLVQAIHTRTCFAVATGFSLALSELTLGQTEQPSLRHGTRKSMIKAK